MSAPTTRARGERADVSRLLFLDSTPAKLILVLFWVFNVVCMVSTVDVLESPWWAVGALLIVNTAARVLTRPHPDPFPAPWAALVVASVVASTVLMSLALPEAGDMGRATWHLGSNTWLLFFLALRRRGRSAWAGMVLMGAVTAAWGVYTGRGALTGLTMLDAHIGILLVATLFALILRRTSARIDELNERSLSSAADTAATEAARQVRRARVTELADVAVPLLERITTGQKTDANLRQELALTEALLRDSVRGRSLAVASVVEAASQARRRGVEVMILDDRGTAPSNGEAMSRMVDVTVLYLARAKGGRVTVRLLPAGRPVALTIVATDGDEVERLTLGEDGARVPSPGS